MPTSRLRVRPPHSHAGLLALTATVAAIMAIPVDVWRSNGPRLLNEFTTGPEYLYALIMLGLMTLPALATFIWIVRQCQHVRWVAAAGAVYGFTAMSFWLLASLLEHPWRTFIESVNYTMGFFLVTTLSIIAALLALLAQRIFSYRIIEQDGTLCDQCGYPAARSGSANCSECGHVYDVRATAFSDRLIERFHRNRRLIFAAIGLFFFGGMGLVLWSEFDRSTLGRSFEGSWTKTHWQQVYRAADDDPHQMVIYVELAQRSAWKPHEIQIGLGNLVIRDSDDMHIIVTGTPRITMRVPVMQARSVLRHGPPEHIIEHLRSVAAAEGWEGSTKWSSISHRKLEVEWADASR